MDSRVQLGFKTLDEVCRICGYSPLDSRHRTRLFGGRSLTDTLQLADTLTAIIGRPVRQGDGLPGYVTSYFACMHMQVASSSS